KALQACIGMDGNMAVAGCDVPPVAIRLAALKRRGEQQHAILGKKGQRDLESGYQLEQSIRPCATGKKRIVALAIFKSAQLQFLDQLSFTAAIVQDFY